VVYHIADSTLILQAEDLCSLGVKPAMVLFLCNQLVQQRAVNAGKSIQGIYNSGRCTLSPTDVKKIAQRVRVSQQIHSSDAASMESIVEVKLCCNHTFF
jgi:hypothetical protein